MKLVLDTNIFISGLILPKSISGKIIASWKGARFSLAYSEPMLTEISRVLDYPKIKKRLKWGDVERKQFISLLMFDTEWVDISDINVVVADDENDAIILATFIKSEADYLVTGDSDLLVMSDQYSIVSPADFAERL